MISETRLLKDSERARSSWCRCGRGVRSLTPKSSPTYSSRRPSYFLHCSAPDRPSWATGEGTGARAEEVGGAAHSTCFSEMTSKWYPKSRGLWPGSPFCRSRSQRKTMYGATPLVHEPPAKRRIMVAPLALAGRSVVYFFGPRPCDPVQTCEVRPLETALPPNRAPPPPSNMAARFCAARRLGIVARCDRAASSSAPARASSASPPRGSARTSR